jgi:hypothetical protein
MTHDPFQSYAMLGAYPGVPTFLPFSGQNYGPFAGGLNPQAAYQQLQQLQLASLLAGQVNPQWQGGQLQGQHNPFGGFQQNPLAGLQQPFGGILQNPLAGLQQPFGGIQQNPLAALQNPLIAATLQNPLLNPLVAQTLGAHLQQGGIGTSPFGQTGYPLAPQSWIGQAGQTGQIHPLYQQLLAQRGLTGINPWGY